jgi:hypothetical protein
MRGIGFEFKGEGHIVLIKGLYIYSSTFECSAERLLSRREDENKYDPKIIYVLCHP